MVFENKYKALLEERKQLFDRVKREFGIGKQLGLASAPWAHSYPTDGVLLPYEKTKDDELFGTYGSFGFGTHGPSDWFKFNEDSHPLIVRPQGKESLLYVVSVYHQNPTNTDKDLFLETITDNALTGLFAHECAEYTFGVLRKKEFPEIEDHEQRMDAIAQSRGFGISLIDYFNTKIKYLIDDNGKEGKAGFDWGKIVNRNSIRELKKRIAELQGRIKAPNFSVHAP